MLQELHSFFTRSVRIVKTEKKNGACNTWRICLFHVLLHEIDQTTGLMVMMGPAAL